MTCICEHGHIFNAKKLLQSCPIRTNKIVDNKFISCGGRIEKYRPSIHLNKDGSFRKSYWKIN